MDVVDLWTDPEARRLWQLRTEEERLTWVGGQMLQELKRMYDMFPRAVGFREWVRAAPLPPKMRRAIRLARQAGRDTPARRRVESARRG